MKPIMLVAHDFEPSAEAALGWAADLQRTTGAPPLHIVHAINILPGGPADLVPIELRPKEIEDLTRRLSAAARTLNAEAIPHVIARALGVGNIIVSAAEEVGANLIVMGTHGRTGVRRFIVGSVAEYVVRHSPCPVVTVRAAP